MKNGDTVIVTAETEDSGALGTLRGQAELEIGGQARCFRIVRIPDGHYEERELRVIDEPPARNPAQRAEHAATPALAAYWKRQT